MRGKNRKAHRAPSARDDFACECLSRLARILVRCGHSPRDLVRQLRDICRTLDEPSRRWDPHLLSLLAELPHVIAVWHADPRYLDAEGRPLGLALHGPRASLGALIKQVLPHENPRSVVAALAEMQGIRRRSGRYFPTGRHIEYQQDTARLNSLTFLVRILRTVEHNVSGARTAAILERNATHPAFPVAALPGFHRRVKVRAADFLWDIDTDLRRREKRFPGGRKTRVGVEIFAFEEPIRGKPPLSKRTGRDGVARAVITARKQRRTAG
jgi:hypothetical protein